MSKNSAAGRAAGGWRRRAGRPREKAITRQRPPRRSPQHWRTLRDRYLERINAEPSLLLPRGKYELARAPGSCVATQRRPASLGDAATDFIEIKALPAAA